MPPPKKKQNKKSLLPSRVMKEKIHTINLLYREVLEARIYNKSLNFFYTLSTCKYVLSITIRKRLDFLLLTIHVHLFISLTHTCNFYYKSLNHFLFLNLIYLQHIYQSCYIYTHIKILLNHSG